MVRNERFFKRNHVKTLEENIIGEGYELCDSFPPHNFNRKGVEAYLRERYRYTGEFIVAEYLHRRDIYIMKRNIFRKIINSLLFYFRS